jgi:hypothetical protein
MMTLNSCQVIQLQLPYNTMNTIFLEQDEALNSLDFSVDKGTNERLTVTFTEMQPVWLADLFIYFPNKRSANVRVDLRR